MDASMLIEVGALDKGFVAEVAVEAPLTRVRPNVLDETRAVLQPSSFEDQERGFWEPNLKSLGALGANEAAAGDAELGVGGEEVLAEQPFGAVGALEALPAPLPVAALPPPLGIVGRQPAVALPG